MRSILVAIRAQWMGFLALVLTTTAITAAAPKVLNLGVNNTAPATTTLVNQGNGAALNLKVKAGQPPLAVNSNKVVPKLNASLLGGKAASAFAAAGASYTKTQSDAKYALTDAGYTKAQSDAKYLAAGAAYTKAQSDAKYLATGAAYTKSEADAKYPRVLTEIDFSGAASGGLSTTVINDVVVNVPAGNVFYVLAQALTGEGGLSLQLNGAAPFGNHPWAVHYASPTAVTIKLTLNDAGVDPTAAGTLVLFVLP